jgi:hypothetical protein
MREICTSGSVGGEGGNILAYPANITPDFAIARRRRAYSRALGFIRATRATGVIFVAAREIARLRAKKISQP